MSRWIGLEPVEGPVLVIGPHGSIQQALTRQGANWASWERLALDGVPATPWMPEGQVATAIVSLPKARQAQRMVVHAAAARLTTGGVLYLHGHNDEGAKSAGKPCREVFEVVEAVDSRKHCRLWRCQGVIGEPKGDIDDWQTTVVADTPHGPLEWRNWPGLFAHGRLDRGTALLLSAMPALGAETRVLDFACGAGVIAQALVQRNPGLRPDLLDVDALAVHAATRNVPEAGHIWLSDGWSAVPRRKWQCIVSNPPLHGAGISRDHTVLWALLEQAGARMTPAAEMWLVTQRNVQLKEPLNERFHQVAVVARDGGFFVWRASRPR